MVVAVIGCTSAKKVGPKPVKEPTEDRTTVVTSAGSAEVFSATSPSYRLWRVDWKGLIISAVSKSKQELKLEPEEGLMDGVEGEAGDDKGGASTFTSERARANKQQQVLLLEGNVVVSSLRADANLTCNRLEWLPKKKRYHAIGNVKFAGELGSLGPLPEVWATPDLKIISMPGL